MKRLLLLVFCCWVCTRVTHGADTAAVGRPVRVVSLCFRPASLETVVPVVEAEARKGTDLICLPETWRGQKVPESLAGPLRERGDRVVQERFLDREQWFILKAVKPGVRVRELARQYGLEELRAYKKRSRDAIDRMRNGS